jgi:hypothetical protein
LGVFLLSVQPESKAADYQVYVSLMTRKKVINIKQKGKHTAEDVCLPQKVSISKGRY